MDTAAPIVGEVIETRITLPDAKQLRSAQAYLDLVSEMVIDSPETLQYAVNERNTMRERYQGAEDTRKWMKEPALEACRRVDAFWKPITTTYEKGVHIIGAKIVTYNAQQLAIVEKAEAEARAQAAKEAAEIRARAAAQEAADRAEAEELLRKEQLAREAERKAIAEGNAAAAAQAVAEAARLASQAQFVVDTSEQKQISMAMEADQVASAVAVVEQAPAMKGLATSYRYGAEVTDKKALLMHIIERRPDLLALVLIDEPALNKQAASLKLALNLPGVAVVKVPILRKGK